ncbi:MAG TPA: 5-guanidino-2-oxopentanoate decarboxylase [Solirubrobacterales bacterium]|nr:5-guanidino-2-oxopentanoate decarboxylase [Solirubrobacterales bacterium]
MRSCARAIVAALEAHGVETIFGIPGTHTLALHEAVAESGIHHVAPRHEEGGGYAADGYARAGGRPGVCLVTTGPGTTNLMTAAATAFHDSVPMLILTPGMPSDVEGRDAGFLHQVKSQSGAMGNVVEWSRRVGSAEEAVAAIDDAFAHFASRRPRPVHVEVPLDVLEGSETERLADPSRARSERPAPAAAELDAAAALLADAEAPWLLLGGGAIYAPAAALTLAERLDAPVVTTVKAKGVVAESHPLSAGASLRFAPAKRALAEADLVLAVGTELAESDLWERSLSFRGKLVRVDLEPAQLAKNATPGLAVRGDAAVTMAALAERLPGAGRRGAERAAAVRAELAPLIERDGAEFALLHRVLGEVLGPDAVVSGDSSQVSYYGTVHQLPCERPRRFLYPVGYATLGYSLPAAIGAKLAGADQAVAIDGDGGFLFTATEIATAAQLRLCVPTIVFDNGGYGEIRAEMLARGAPPLGVDMDPVDFPALARALGGAGESVPYAAGPLGEALAKALERPGPTVLAIDRR